MDSKGKLVDAVASPAGYSYDHTEWVTGKNAAVATLTDKNMSHKKIVLIDMETKKIVELVESDELWHPVLWIEQSTPAVEKSSSSSEIAPNSSSSGNSEPESSSSSKYSLVLDPDSAGIYAFSYAQFKDFIIRYKMELLWQFADSANVVVLGSSRPLNAVYPTRLSSKFTGVNLGLASCTIHMSKDILMKYIWPHYKKLKYVVVSLDLDFWWKTASAKDNNWFADNDANAKYLLYPGFVYDKNHDYWAGEEDITPLQVVATILSHPEVNCKLLAQNRGQGQTLEQPLAILDKKSSTAL